MHRHSSTPSAHPPALSSAPSAAAGGMFSNGNVEDVMNGASDELNALRAALRSVEEEMASPGFPDVPSSEVYSTVAYKSIGLTEMPKLTPGKREEQLNWWFDFSTALERLNLQAVASSGMESSDPRHPCGPTAVRDLHAACVGAVRHNASLMADARTHFPSANSGAAFLAHLHKLYVAPHLSVRATAEADVESFSFSMLGDVSTTREQAVEHVSSFFRAVARLPASRQGDMRTWAEYIILRVPDEVESQVCKLYGDVCTNDSVLASTSDFAQAVGAAVDKIAAKRALAPSSKAFATSSWRSTRTPDSSRSTGCPAGCDLKFCPKFRDASSRCDVFELTPQRAAELLNMDNNYHRAVHAVRLKNKLCGVNELARSTSSSSPAPVPVAAPTPAPPPAPASAPTRSTPEPGSRAFMLQAQMDMIASQLDRLNEKEEKEEKPAAPRLY